MPHGRCCAIAAIAMPDSTIRLKASKLSNAQAQRQAIARDRERTLRLAERARRALRDR